MGYKLQQKDTFCHGLDSLVFHGGWTRVASVEFFTQIIKGIEAVW